MNIINEKMVWIPLFEQLMNVNTNTVLLKSSRPTVRRMKTPCLVFYESIELIRTIKIR